jgi:two-component system, OmpR family, phosphate regulon sensor histidine kinase PhoR
VRFSSNLSKLVIVYLLLQGGLTLALILFSRSQNRELAVTEIDEQLYHAACGLQPTIETILTSKRGDRETELDKIVREFNAKTKVRVTVVSPEGDVLTDSEANRQMMDNHKQRPEVIQASQGKVGKATRMSGSTKTEYYYLAVPLSLNDEPLGFLRLARETVPIQRRLSRFSTAFFWFAFATALLASIVLIGFARAAVRPLRDLTLFARSIAKGDYKRRLSPVHWQGEWRLLGNAFDQMQNELRTREGDLRTNSDRLSAVLSSMHEGIVAIDQQRRVLLANRAAAVLLDIPFQELLNRRFSELTRNPVIEQCVEDVFRMRRTIDQEIETKRQPRRVLSVRFSWIAQYQDDVVVMVVHDVTSLRQLETMRRDFVANVSHELKTPLSSIKAYSETLRLGAMDDLTHRMKFVERIEEQANRLSDLILDLIRLARIESGLIAFEIRDIDLGKIALQRTEAFREQAEKRSLTLRAEMGDAAIVVRCDEEGLATILDNLISNAVRYTPEGGQVIVRCSKDAEMGVIEVIDNGQGIAPEHQERIFERFYRVDKARSSDLGGTGLGLSIVKHFVQSFSGRVVVSSRLGKGSTFTARLPLANPGAQTSSHGSTTS